MYWGADKSLARPGRKKDALVKGMMSRGMDMSRVGTGGGLL